MKPSAKSNGKSHQLGETPKDLAKDPAVVAPLVWASRQLVDQVAVVVPAVPAAAGRPAIVRLKLDLMMA